MVGGAIGAAGAGIAGAADAVSSGVSGAVDKVSSGVSGAVDTLSSGVSGAVDTVSSGISGAVDGAKSGVSGAVDSATSGVSGAVGAVSAGVAGAVDTAKSGVSGAVDAVSSGVSGAVETAKSGVSGAADAVSSSASGALDKAGDVAGAGTAALAAVGTGAVAAAGAAATKAKRAAKSVAGDTDADGQGGTAMPLVGSAGDGMSAAAAAGAIGIAAAVGDPDDLLKIKGVGPKLNALLNKLGVTRFDQIAAWTNDDVAKVDAHMEDFQGRIGREEWIPQARLLATGQDAEWERLYGADTSAAGKAGAVALTAIGVPAAIGDPDDLLQIKGIGPKLNALLISLGITRFDQIAAWGPGEVDKVDDHLGNFKSRIGRDAWVEQAGLLAAGNIAAFEAKFGKLDSENK